MTFSEHMRHIRGELTQSAFCRKIGIPLTTYQRYEKGERVPDIDVLAQIVKRTGISADTLLGLDHMTDAQGIPDRNAQALLDKKESIIALQAATIENLSQAIKALR